MVLMKDVKVIVVWLACHINGVVRVMVLKCVRPTPLSKWGLKEAGNTDNSSFISSHFPVNPGL
jgi:hypothetical protein